MKGCEGNYEVKVFRVSNLSIINQCYLIYKNGAGFLIDPAWDFYLINNFIFENKISLKGVLLTHAHEDHTDLAQTFAEKYDVPVFMSAIEVESSNFDCLNLQKVWPMEKIETGSFNITPIHAPGHTIGSICYLIDQHLFTGDTVFIEGVGICDRENVDKLYDSVQFLKLNLSIYTFIWPGHSFGETAGKTIKYLHKNNLYFQLDDRAQFIEFRMRKNKPNPFNFK